MDIKSLMVGDWVYNKHHNKNIRLTPYDFFTHTHNEFGEQELAPFAKPTIGRDLEPIPLTPEILEKNGFECKQKKEALNRMYWILYVEGGSVKVKINRGLFLFNIFGVPFQHGFYIPSVNKHILYIHDLQHALRLCGVEKTIEL